MKRLPMEARFGGMAEATVHRRYVGGRMGEWQVLVAQGAPDSGWAMDGRRQRFRGHQEAVSPLDSLKHGGIPVTQETHIVPLPLERFLRDEKSHEDKGHRE